ncbi:hypothetical protein [uncultured Pseudokineococcus sp.]|uniref:hypothetical protein n=1 Tax=uncultured Pseudokineococcus sp. TaxID=1642928 RepID=UPI00260880E1|nr:hypothetical protein [uncultured Pseudokineococcus sp.]
MVRKHPWLTLFAVRIAVVVAALALVDLVYPDAGFFLSVVVALAASAVVGALVEKQLGIDPASRRAALEEEARDGQARPAEVDDQAPGTRDEDRGAR